MLRYSEWALRRRGYLDFLAKRPVDAFAPDFADLWYLYRLVCLIKPKVIVEFGSGCSTVILAQALYDNARHSGVKPGILYSLDASLKWAKITQRTMPDRLAGLYEIRYAPVVIVTHEGRKVFRHSNVPQVPIDMLYLDGPAFTPEIRVAIDPLDLEPLFRLGFVGVIDGRQENVEYIKRHLKGHYIFKYNWSLNNTIFQLVKNQRMFPHDRIL